jgi:F-type H+-transporting ATPase subunit gamma
MPGLKEIKRRITSVKSTKQITKAMKMVAAAKFRRAVGRIIQLRPYASKMHAVLSSMAKNVESGHPLLDVRIPKKVEVLVFSSDRGLCGGFNSNIMKNAFRIIKGLQAEGKEVSVSTVGKKATELFKRRKINPRQSWVGLSGRITYEHAQQIATDIIDNYINETFDEVTVIYTEFKSAAVQSVIILRLLPFKEVGSADAPAAAEASSGEVLFEPSQEVIFERLLPKNIEIQIFRSLLDSQASEEAARMAAMENATKSADDMIKRLTLQYNKARQAAITKELMDIVGGVEALKK